MPIAVMTKPAASADGDATKILPRVEWATKAGRLFRVERFQDSAGEWQKRKVDITTVEVVKDGETLMARPAMLFDFASAANTWTRFFPSFDEIAVALDGVLPPKPPVYRDEAGNAVKDKYGKVVEHSQVLRIPVYSPQVFGSDEPLHELSAKGDNVVRAVAGLFDIVESNPEYQAGKLPVVQWAGSTATGKNGDLYVPTFKILGWRERPAEVPHTPRPKIVGAPPVSAKNADIGEDLPF